MCGRFALHNFHLNRVADEYPDIPPRRWEDEEDFHPRYNVAPQTHVLAIMQQPNGQGQHDVVVQTMRWGLQAKWSNPNSTSFKNPINARSEVVLAGSANIWNTVRGSKHCIVFCEGYYEWLKSGTKRTPHYVKRPDGHLMLLAGFYEVVNPTKPPGKTIYTCTILTTEPNDQLAFLHDRMPVILDGQQAMKWMEAGRKWKPEVLEELRKPYKGDLICYEVPAGVGRVGNEDPAFVEPLAERKDGLKAMMNRIAQKPKQEPSSPPTKRESPPPKQEPLDSPAKRKREVKSENETISLSPRTVVKAETPIKPEPEHIVLGDDSDSDIEEDTSRQQAGPKSSPTKKRQSVGSVKRTSSPVEIDLVDSGSDSDVHTNTARKKRKSDVQEPKSASSASQKRRPGKSSRAPSRKSLTDFFGRR